MVIFLLQDKSSIVSLLIVCLINFTSGASDEGSGNFRSRKSARSDMPLTTAPRSDSDYYNSNDYKDYRDDSQSDRNYYPGYSQEGNEDIEEDYPDSNEVDEETKLRSRIAMLIGKLDPSDLYDNGHSFSDMIVNCTWKGQDCKSG